MGDIKNANCESVLRSPSAKAKIKDGTASCNVMNADYCTEWATIKCSQSSHYLKMNPVWFTNRPHYGEYNHKGLAISDCIPDIDYPCVTAPWNMCFSICNPWVLQASIARQAADPAHVWMIVPMPCFLAHVPIGMWKGAKGDHKYSFVPYSIGSLLLSRNPATIFKSNPAKVDSLTKGCTLTCLWMGTLTVMTNGRESYPVPYDPVTGLMGPNPLYLLRNACGMLMNYTGVVGTVLFGALDSVCAGIQTYIDTDDGMAAFKAGVVNMLGVVAGLGIGAAIMKGGSKIKDTKFGKFFGSIGGFIKGKMKPNVQLKADGFVTKTLKWAFKPAFRIRGNYHSLGLVDQAGKATNVTTYLKGNGMMSGTTRFQSFIKDHKWAKALASANFSENNLFKNVDIGNTYQIPNIADETVNRAIGLFTGNDVGKTGYKEGIDAGISLLWDTPSDNSYQKEPAVEDNNKDYKAGGTAWDDDGEVTSYLNTNNEVDNSEYFSGYDINGI